MCSISELGDEPPLPAITGPEPNATTGDATRAPQRRDMQSVDVSSNAYGRAQVKAAIVSRLVKGPDKRCAAGS